MNSPTLKAEGLSVAYGRKLALRDISFELPNGLHGLLGPNGAGKSTLFAALVGMVSPSAGQITLGEDLLGRRIDRDVRAMIGYLPQRFDTVGSMRVVDTVEFAAWANGHRSAACRQAATDALAIVELTEHAHERVRTLSGGQRQRLGIACAISHRPKLLLLDEPTVGLDPEQRIKVRMYLSRVAQNAVVLTSTHLVEDLAQIAERVLVLLDGEIAFDGTTADLAARARVRDEFTSPLESGYRSVASGIS